MGLDLYIGGRSSTRLIIISFYIKTRLIIMSFLCQLKLIYLYDADVRLMYCSKKLSRIHTQHHDGISKMSSLIIESFVFHCLNKCSSALIIHVEVKDGFATKSKKHVII